MAPAAAPTPAPINAPFPAPYPVPAPTAAPVPAPTAAPVAVPHAVLATAIIDNPIIVVISLLRMTPPFASLVSPGANSDDYEVSHVRLLGQFDHDEVPDPDVGQVDGRIYERLAEVGHGLTPLRQQHLGLVRESDLEGSSYGVRSEFVDGQRPRLGGHGEHRPSMPLLSRRSYRLGRGDDQRQEQQASKCRLY